MPALAPRSRSSLCVNPNSELRGPTCDRGHCYLELVRQDHVARAVRLQPQFPLPLLQLRLKLQQQLLGRKAQGDEDSGAQQRPTAPHRGGSANPEGGRERGQGLPLRDPPPALPGSSPEDEDEDEDEVCHSPAGPSLSALRTHGSPWANGENPRTATGVATGSPSPAGNHGFPLAPSVPKHQAHATVPCHSPRDLVLPCWTDDGGAAPPPLPRGAPASADSTCPDT